MFGRKRRVERENRIRVVAILDTAIAAVSAFASNERDDLWCPHCGKQLEDSLCPTHGVPDDYTDYDEAMRIRDEQKQGFEG